MNWSPDDGCTTARQLIPSNVLLSLLGVCVQLAKEVVNRRKQTCVHVRHDDDLENFDRFVLVYQEPMQNLFSSRNYPCKTPLFHRIRIVTAMVRLKASRSSNLHLPFPNAAVRDDSQTDRSLNRL